MPESPNPRLPPPPGVTRAARAGCCTLVSTTRDREAVAGAAGDTTSIVLMLLVTSCCSSPNCVAAWTIDDRKADASVFSRLRVLGGWYGLLLVCLFNAHTGATRRVQEALMLDRLAVKAPTTATGESEISWQV